MLKWNCDCLSFHWVPTQYQSGHQTHPPGRDFPRGIIENLFCDSWIPQPDSGYKHRSEWKEERTCEGISCPVTALMLGLTPCLRREHLWNLWFGHMHDWAVTPMPAGKRWLPWVPCFLGVC